MTGSVKQDTGQKMSYSKMYSVAVISSDTAITMGVASTTTTSSYTAITVPCGTLAHEGRKSTSKRIKADQQAISTMMARTKVD